jgi:hypothetical protein
MVTTSDLHHSVMLLTPESGHPVGTNGLLMYVDAASAIVEVERPDGDIDVIWVDASRVAPVDRESRAA